MYAWERNENTKCMSVPVTVTWLLAQTLPKDKTPNFICTVFLKYFLNFHVFTPDTAVLQLRCFHQWDWSILYISVLLFTTHNTGGLAELYKCFHKNVKSGCAGEVRRILSTVRPVLRCLETLKTGLQLMKPRSMWTGHLISDSTLHKGLVARSGTINSCVAVNR